MGAKVDAAATAELNKLNGLLKSGDGNMRKAQQALQDGVDKQTAQLMKNLGETQKLLAKVKTKLNDHTSRLGTQGKKLEDLKKQQKKNA